ncbi:hypothetical protein L2E82_34739 [Cichorium intybus]|uniref:Uncharacterized protein n=1 Tax=Cichorium intybus TaxID=13427 RepID=A0ACB9BMP1_CICIN|nr:hypothetical protein L2E82_34739 [Cichorium intybus]
MIVLYSKPSTSAQGGEYSSRGSSTQGEHGDVDDDDEGLSKLPYLVAPILVVYPNRPNPDAGQGSVHQSSSESSGDSPLIIRRSRKHAANVSDSPESSK